MILRKIFLILLAFFFHRSFSQDLKYHSNLEQEVFRNFRLDSIKIDFFTALNSIDSIITKEDIKEFKSKTDNFISSLPPKEDKVKKERKRIKKIYDKIHQQFFKQYLIDAYFPDIYKTGNYNCVTATALYAYIFDQIKVPYSIKESPAHVYMVAYPESNRIHLETTIPGGLAFKEFEPSQIKATINQLVESKLISADTLSIKGYSKTFYDYFYNNENLKRNGLIGVQYYNKAITEFNDENYNLAENNLLKAAVFYDSEIAKYLIKSIIRYKLSELDYSKAQSIDYFVISVNKMKLKEDYKLSDIKSSIYKFLAHDDVNEEAILKAEKKFNNLTDSITHSEVLEMTYHYLAEKNTSEEENEKAIKYTEKLQEINPKNKHLKSLLGYNITRKFALLPMTKKSLVPIDTYIEKYPFLLEDRRIVSFKYTLLLKSTYDDFKGEKIKEGEISIQKMEAFFDQYKEFIQVNPDRIAEIYRMTGSYYYGKKKYAKAIKMYNKGLKHNPENVQIKKLLRWAKEDGH